MPSERETTKPTGGRHLVNALTDGGCDRLFVVPGSSMVSLLHELRSTDIEVVPALHESVAVAMADGYARLRGVTPVALYMAPGTANAMANLYNAWCDDTPLLVVTAQQRTAARTEGAASVGEADLVNLVGQWTRYAWEVPGGDQLPAALAAAARAAAGPPGGPAFLSVPQDVLEGPVPGPVEPWTASRQASVPADLTALIDALRDARVPMIVAGGQVQRTGGESALVALAEALGAPVFYEPFWRDRLPIAPHHPLAMGELTERSSNAREADVVLAVGCRMFQEIHPRPDPWFPAAHFIAHANLDPGKLQTEWPAHWSAVADPSLLLAALADEFARHPLDPQALSQRNQRNEDGARRRSARAATVQRQATAGLATALDLGYVVDESVSVSNDLIAGLASGPADRYICNTGGSLGWGMGAAGGVALASGSIVTCVIGDGAFFFGLQALWNARVADLPIVFVVFDNGGFGSTRYFEDRYAGGVDVGGATRAPYIGSDFRGTRPAIVDVARSFGLETMSVSDPGDVAAAYARCAERMSGPALICVEIPFG